MSKSKGNVITPMALLEERSRRGLERRDERLRSVLAKLNALSPLAILARGYAVASTDTGHTGADASFAVLGRRACSSVFHCAIGCCEERLSTAFTRAISSRIENGLVT
mgnify:CR=1 FL=1